MKGPLKGFLKGPCTRQPKVPSKPLQNSFKNPSKTFQEGVEIDDAFGFSGLQNQFQGPGVLWQEMKGGKDPCFSFIIACCQESTGRKIRVPGLAEGVSRKGLP